MNPFASLAHPIATDPVGFTNTLHIARSPRSIIFSGALKAWATIIAIFVAGVGRIHTLVQRFVGKAFANPRVLCGAPRTLDIPPHLVACGYSAGVLQARPWVTHRTVIILGTSRLTRRLRPIGIVGKLIELAFQSADIGNAGAEFSRRAAIMAPLAAVPTTTIVTALFDPDIAIGCNEGTVGLTTRNAVVAGIVVANAAFIERGRAAPDTCAVLYTRI
tara:strand:- start:576 stop:1229 length:654 start_codon:yes stop_codon:yes gene_type:complete